VIPNVPDWLEGVIELHGRVVPVIDLRKRFELPEAPLAPATRTLVLGVDGEWIAAVVDAVVEVAPVEPAQLAPPPALFHGLAGEYIKGIVRRGEELVVLLDVARILTTNERIILEQTLQGAARHE
jgi:purine-binding chemotaxis protein CheW